MASRIGRFVVRIPPSPRRMDRIRTVGRATVRIAEMLGADIEVQQRHNASVVWVYYDNGNKEELLYHDWSRDWSEEYIFNYIRRLLYGQSFLPEHAELQVVRGMLA